MSVIQEKTFSSWSLRIYFHVWTHTYLRVLWMKYQEQDFLICNERRREHKEKKFGKNICFFVCFFVDWIDLYCCSKREQIELNFVKGLAGKAKFEWEFNIRKIFDIRGIKIRVWNIQNESGVKGTFGNYVTHKMAFFEKKMLRNKILTPLLPS